MNRHVSINIDHALDYQFILQLFGVAAALVAVFLYWGHNRHALARARMQLAQRRAEQERAARQEQSRLMALLSHEIRTSLSVIDGAAQSLQLIVDARDEACAQSIVRIRHGVRRLAFLGAEQFLAKDRLDDANLRLRCVPIDARALGEALCMQIDADMRVRMRAHGDCTLSADPDLLEVALRNLLINALRYSPQGSEVAFTIVGLPECVKFRVANEGPGSIRIRQCAITCSPAKSVTESSFHHSFMV